jgi:putative Mg2+ transporter-C (MgtC) family protein
MLVTAFQGDWLVRVPLETIRTDPTRMAQGIMTGIGFLGAGVIFKEGVTVRGLTTAASIWTTAAIGILFGVGFYYPAILSTVIVLGILALFRLLEDRIPTQL